MNDKVLKTLEYDKILEKIAVYATGETSRELIKKTTPESSIDNVRDMIEETDEAVRLLLKFSNPPSIGISDHKDILKRTNNGGTLTIIQLLKVMQLLRVSGFYIKYSENFEEDGKLRYYSDNIYDYSNIAKEIDSAVLNDDELKDTASDGLFSVRRGIKTVNDKIKSSLSSAVSGRYSKFLQEPIVTSRNGRYVIPVKSEHRSAVKGIVHDASSTGATLFIEPIEVVELNNKLRELEGKEKEETEKILRNLSSEIAAVSESISVNIDMLSSLDAVFSKAKYALDIAGVKPRINRDGKINLIKAVHPLLDRKKAVPIDIRLGFDYTSLIVTGPNTGGKTISLKTLGLLTLMVQSGILIPLKEESEISVFEEIYADIGDEQSIEQSLSTFSAHMTNTVEILKKVNEKSLVLFDELGAGTDPAEGAALAVSILEYVKEKGARVMATTHYNELKLYAMETEGAENACCEFDVETLRPTYKLMIGIPGKSNAFEISRKLGLDESVIEMAKKHISSDKINFENVIKDLEQKRFMADKEHKSAQSLNIQASAYKASLENERNALERKKEKIIENAVEEARKIIEETKKETDAMLAEIIELRKNKMDLKAEAALENLKKELKKKNKKLVSGKKKSESVYPGEIPDNVLPGTTVYITNMDTNGQVLSTDNKKNATVQAGILKLTIPLANLRIVKDDTGKEAVKNYIRTTSTLSKTLTLSPELDVRGLYADEAISKVEKFIDDAEMSSLKTVTIIHGKGTGALRKAIHEHLSGHPYVKNFRLGNYGEGDHGVTVVELS